MSTNGQSAAMPSPFPPIADYGFLSDCHTGALVAPDGGVDWLCVPRFDSPSVFGSLLDREAGTFRFGPFGINVPTQRVFVAGTNVLITTWKTPSGWVVVRDALTIGPATGPDVVTPHTRPPADDDAEHLLVRTAECVDGEVDIELVCEPVFDYGATAATWTLDADGHGADASAADATLRLHTDMAVGIEAGRVRARRTLRVGDRVFCALSWADGLVGPADLDDATRRIDTTVQFWRDWLDRARIPDHRWRDPIQRSALTIKGLTYMPTGATVAALTTSLPETPGGERNWDYRYSWLRDSTFMLWALFTLGFNREATDFFYFIADRVEDEDLQIMYGIDGRGRLDEVTLDHLSGYEGARPVRVGNDAWHQRQHDVWGVLLDSVRLHTHSSDRLDDRLWTLITRQVDAALEHWREPDRGIWEVRGDPKHFTSSKLFCWVAADRGARLARLRGDTTAAERWEAAAREMHDDICANGTDARGVFVQHYETDALDASLLLLPLIRFLSPTDERVRATVLAIADELTVDGLVLRYRVKETDDGLAGEEGTFTICSFWLVSALAEIGELDRARTLCEKLLSYASPLLLYAEEIEPHSGRHLGNFPQAFAHLALINAVMHIIRADQSLTEGPEILTEAPGRLAVQFGLELEPADAAPHPNASGDDAGRDA